MKTNVKQLCYLVVFGLFQTAIIHQNCFAQALSGSKEAPGISVLHRANLGRITFAAQDILLDNYKESDFLNFYEFTNKSALYFTAFIDKPLAQYLPALFPERSVAELTDLGSYQFSFYVDNALIYVCHMPPNNIEPETKLTETVIKQPFFTRPRQRVWGESIWNLFLRNGGQQALTDGKHLFKMEIRPFLQVTELTAGNIIAEGQLALDVKLNPKIEISTVQLQPIQPYQDLKVSKEKFDVNKIKELKGKTDEAVFKDITSIVVLKNGQLLIEEYFNNADRNILHDVRSVGKSFASTATGIAIHEGFLKCENQKLKEFYNLNNFANYSLQKENTTLQDLLTMSSVFAGNDDKRESPGNEERMYPTKDWVKFALDLPEDIAKPKGEWQYFTAGVVVLGDILDKKVPGGLEKYADAKLFKPLGIMQYKWQYTPQKVANTAGSIRMNALDFAKYGQLYKNGGKWNGKQILPEEWIKKTFTKHKTIPGRTDEHYGYLFWNKKYTVKGKSYETFYCTGNGGNKIFVFQDSPLVVVVTATAYGTPYAHPQVDKIMTDYILPAILNDPK